MAAHRIGPATAADLAALPDGVRAEIIHGAIVERVGPSAEHSMSQISLGSAVTRRFQRTPGGRWPGGWWFGSEIEVEYETHEVFVHDVAGWRRDRVPQRPTGRPIRIRLDWACEILSPTNQKRDLVDKLNVLHATGVPHYWIVDPLEQALVVYRWAPGEYQTVLSAGAGMTVRAEPFEAVELRVSALLGLEDDDE